MPQGKGSLVVVGTGIEALGQMTEAARREIRRAERVHYVADPVSAQAILAINPRSMSLQHLYDTGKHRLKTYAQMTERVLSDVRAGHRVCFASYGHPGVFAIPTHAAVKMARNEGYRAVMLPAVSADACLIADLGVDPGATGWQSYEATDFLLRRRKPDPSVGLVLWQVGVVGRLDYPEGPVDRKKLALLTKALLKHYPSRHTATLYEAASLPGFPPSIDEVRIGSLHKGPVTSITTLYVPPVRTAKIDRTMMARLGIRDEGKLRCLR
ncbi:MAG TPA: SAM-dependent methyltransferase [Casimicrobiaceae bacterium]|nr:SAM-dependent methyltransferase [Casimicrobiaceae bacterium]